MEILIYLLKTGSLLALFFLIYEVFLKRETFFTLNRIFLISGIIIAFGLPFFSFTKTQVVEKVISTAPISEAELLSDFSFEHVPVVENETLLSNLEWSHILLLIYGMGILFFLIRFGISLFSLRKILKSSSHSFKENGFRFIETAKETNPFTFFKTIVYNPKQYKNDELKMILHHEKTHAKQWHSVDILISQVLIVFQWMNPIAWLYAKRMDQNLEFIADQKTTSENFSKKTYQIKLLQSAYYGELSLPVNNFHSFTKNRIVMMNKNKSHRMKSLKALVVLPFLAIFLMSFQIKTETKNIYKQVIAEVEIHHLDVQNAIQQELKEEPSSSDEKPVKSSKPTIHTNEIISHTDEVTEVMKHKDSLKNKKIMIVYSDNTSSTTEIKDLDEIIKLARKNASKAGKEAKTTYSYVLSQQDSLKIQIPEKINIQNSREQAHKTIEIARAAKGYGLSESEFSKLQNGETIIIENGSQSNDAEFPKNISQIWVLKDGEMKYIKAESKNGETVLLQFPVNKNTSDDELKTMKNKFSEHGIDFKVSRLKRNKAGEITDLKMTLNNRKGANSQISQQGSDGIKAYKLGMNPEGKIFMISKN